MFEVEHQTFKRFILKLVLKTASPAVHDASILVGYLISSLFKLKMDLQTQTPTKSVSLVLPHHAESLLRKTSY